MSVIIEVVERNQTKPDTKAVTSEKKSILPKGLFKRIKSIKHIEFIIAGIIGCIILLLFISSFSSPSVNNQNNNQTSQSASAVFISDLETRLANTLSQISGAGNVSVMITLETSAELIPYFIKDKNTQTTTTNSGSGSNTITTSTEKETPVLSGNTPFILKEISPSIRGVLIVASGASDIRVRLEIMRAIETLCGIDQNKVQVLTKK